MKTSLTKIVARIPLARRLSARGEVEVLFKRLQTEQVKNQEELDLWFLRAEDCIKLFLGNNSAPFVDLLKNRKGPVSQGQQEATTGSAGTPAPSTDKSPSDKTKDFQARVEAANKVLAAARNHPSVSSAKAEEDPDLRKEAEYAISEAARKSWLLKIGFAILITSAGLATTGILKIGSTSIDVENRIQQLLEKRKAGLNTAADNATNSLEGVRIAQETELKTRATNAVGYLERVRHTNETEFSNHAVHLSQGLDESVLEVKSNIMKEGSLAIQKISGTNVPELRGIANRIGSNLLAFEERLDRGTQRQAEIEGNLNGLEGLSDRLDRTTIDELKQLAPTERKWALATRYGAGLALALWLIAGLRYLVKKYWSTQNPRG